MSLLGIDLGTSGVKAGVFSLDGACIGQAYSEYDMLHPQPGWSELDSSKVWKTTCEVIAKAVAQAGSDPVSALSAGSFGEAVVPVSKNRKILDNSILCVDERGQEHIDRLLADFGHEAFYEINPNLLGPNYSMPKILWLKEHRTEVYKQADLFLHWADFITFMLGAKPSTNNSHANRTLLFDLKKNDWSDELVEWSGIDCSKLAPVVSGGTVTGMVADAMAEQLGLPKGVKTVSGGHDQCCNALGCGGVSAGRAVYGMGSFDCITPVYSMPSNLQEMRINHLNVEHHLVPDLFVSFHYNQAGLLVKWFRDTFTDGSVSYAQLDKEMPDDPSSLLVLPHFDTPPHHSPDTAGVIVGLRTSTQRGEILKAIQEGTALYFLEGMDALNNLGLGASEYIASGGGARSDKNLQLRADILGVPVVRPVVTEAGLLGSAMNAGVATGVFQTPEGAAERCVRVDRRFEPNAERHAFYREKQVLYKQMQPSLLPVFQDL